MIAAAMDGPQVPAPASVAVVPTEQERKALWLAERTHAITATDAGKILTGKGLAVWLEKVGQAEPFDEASAPDYMLAGRYYERGTLAWYADREGVPIEFADSYRFIRHPDAALPVGCTLDARRLDDGRPVDAKMIHRWSPYDPDSGTGWGEHGSDQVPTIYAAQGAVQMAVMGTDRMDFPVFFRGDGEFVIYRLRRDPEREARLLAFLSGWWARHVVACTAPAVDGSEDATRFLARIERTTELVRPATAEDDAIAHLLERTKDDLAEIKMEHDRLTNLLRERTGTDLGIMGKGWKFTHKANKPTTTTDWEAVARDLAKALDTRGERWRAVLAEYTARHVITKEGARVARFTTTKKES